MDYFKNKCVLITGGSSGIGLATAKLLRKVGANLVLMARNEERLQQAQSELEKIYSPGSEVRSIALDVSDREALEREIPVLLAERPVDVLINNAGISMPGKFLDLPLSQFDEMMQVNFLGAVHLTQMVVPSMIERHDGHVAFVSSLAGLMGIYGYTAYGASKFAMRGFAEALRCEMKPHNIRVSICYPPDTDTPQHEFEQQHLPDETRAIAGNAAALSAEDVASALLQKMAAGRFHIVPGASARFADIAYRLFPWMVRSMFDSDVSKAQSKS